MGRPAQRTYATASGYLGAFGYLDANFLENPYPDVPDRLWFAWVNLYETATAQKRGNLIYVENQGEPGGFTVITPTTGTGDWPVVAGDEDTGLINRYAECFYRGAFWARDVTKTVMLTDPPLNGVDARKQQEAATAVAQNLCDKATIWRAQAMRYGPPWVQPFTGS